MKKTLITIAAAAVIALGAWAIGLDPKEAFLFIVGMLGA